MKKMNRFLGALLSVVGLLILIFPAACVKMVAVLLGLGAISYGVFTLVESKKLTFDTSFFKNATLIKSVASIVLGLLTVILPLAIASTAWKIIVYIFAVFLIFTAGFGFYTVSVSKDSVIDRKKSNVENFSLLIAGVLLLLISPEKLGKFIICIIGLVTLIIGLVLVVIQIINFKNKKNEIVLDTDSSEVEVVDEPASDSENQ